jgi:transcriptional regulator
MYTPKNMTMLEDTDIATFIQENGFAVMVDKSLSSSHLPFILEAEEGEKGTLYGHIAKANSQWKDLDGQDVLVVFSGPHAYISPTWYSAQPAVPTWNYAAVHCYGKVELLNPDETMACVNMLVAKYEPELLENKSLMPDDYQVRLSQAIVGFKLAITDIQAKEKLGQHRSAADQLGTHLGLSESSNSQDRLLAVYMTQRGIGTGVSSQAGSEKGQ